MTSADPLRRIADALAGRRILLTGATGFLGTAVLERLLHRVPGSEVVVLVRPGRRSSSERRLEREVLRNNAFGPMRAALGDRFDTEVRRRLHVVAGDVGADGLALDQAGRELVAGCDLVIHSAATVAFDSPLDAAVEVNLLGPTRIAETLRSLGADAHLVSVSTCYVAGTRRGAAPEELLADGRFDLEVPWRPEVDAARRARADTDAESRSPEQLERFRRAARRELGAAGVPLLADRTEQLRRRWVDERLVDAGRARARSLGWPDAYAYTKALGEAALVETRGDLPVTFVRPSIIESALAFPFPGWIRGFRMAEPVIISYARALLKEFPGVPEGTVDVIPVDLVVGAICAVAAAGPDRDAARPPVVQVASGAVNPLTYRRLVELGRDYFTRNPLYDAKGQPILVPDWSFPGRGRVEGQLRRAKAMLDRAERALTVLPLRGRQAELSARVEERRDEIDRASSYVELYGAYAECEAIYQVDHLLGLWARVQPDDRDTFTFDPRVVDWTRYALEIHLPSVVEQARVRTTPGGRSGPSREERLRAQVLAPERQLAAFDLENTLIASNVVASYAWLATRRLPWADRARFVAQTLAEAPRLLSLDRRDRSDFLRFFYRRYEGAPVGQLETDARELMSFLLLTKAFPDGLRRVREHRARGHRTVLITGALDVVIAPFAPLFDDVICARMGVRPGRRGPVLTGELVAQPPTGEARADVLATYAADHGLDLAETVAYADSTSDLPMLDVAGFPVAVNPETRLSAIARKRGWLVEQWAPAPGGSAPVVPIAPLTPSARLRPPHDLAWTAGQP